MFLFFSRAAWASSDRAGRARDAADRRKLSDFLAALLQYVPENPFHFCWDGASVSEPGCGVSGRFPFKVRCLRGRVQLEDLWAMATTMSQDPMAETVASFFHGEGREVLVCRWLQVLTGALPLQGAGGWLSRQALIGAAEAVERGLLLDRPTPSQDLILEGSRHCIRSELYRYSAVAPSARVPGIGAGSAVRGNGSRRRRRRRSNLEVETLIRRATRIF
ncbi:unnamed protein product [Prorocentrum cordatum]|uniref:Uncharacterized protein n=1 Tax=Prorocentrum cordatum TaxID=2364126 RepID=A0ABN9TSL6_9DINO|nr:unnamed protein product [Polarella glacialis]